MLDAFYIVSMAREIDEDLAVALALLILLCGYAYWLERCDRRARKQ